MLVLVVLVVGTAFFVMAAMLRRWYALLVPAGLWATQLVATALTSGIGDSENRPESVILVWTIFVLAPMLATTALGVVAGRAFVRARERRRHSNPT